ncbi:hypothetical protein [uncultured Draconibacterium sp.]|uniref:hypothetical protein n=1 Tax=uncultured Draconibacterium sp. TaxID=1573823 RepID=UPI0029C97782|nr:hypothetical protein [uncultured Draconibacterium sp.]
MNYTTIKTNLFRVRYRRKDGKQQLKILVKIGYLSDNKFRELKRFEVTVRDKLNNLYLVSDQQYKNLKITPPTIKRLNLFETETKVKKIVQDLINDKIDFSVNEINNRLYSIQNDEAISLKVKTWNEFLNSVNSEAEDSTYQQDEIERIEKAINEEIEEAAKRDKVLTDEEIDNIKDSVGIEMQIEKEKEYVKTLSLDERYAKHKFDTNDIIEVFGFCWSKNPKNGDTYIPKSYKLLIFHFADYFINGDTVSKSIKSFNQKWVERFLSFKIKKGFPKTHFKGYTPFNIFDYRESLEKAEREDFKIASFRKLVKILRHYINMLQKHGLLSPNAINTNHIDAADYISRNTISENYTKTEYTLELEEIEQLLSAKFEDEKMQLAVDMYIIQMFAGGLRPVELLEGNIKFTDSSVTFYRKKNKRLSINPILPEVQDVLIKYPNGLPTFLNISTYRDKLKEVARHFKWNRIIHETNTKLKPDQPTIQHELHEIFSPMTARKTFINYLANMGLPDEVIIQFTDHADVRILKHYKRKLNLQQKQQVIQNLLDNFYKTA